MAGWTQRGTERTSITIAMLDLTAAFASLATLREGQTAATASLSISLQAAVRAGPLIGTGFVERAGRRLIFARAQLQGGDGSELLASAHAVMSVLEANQIAGGQRR